MLGCWVLLRSGYTWWAEAQARYRVDQTSNVHFFLSHGSGGFGAIVPLSCRMQRIRFWMEYDGRDARDLLNVISNL